MKNSLKYLVRFSLPNLLVLSGFLAAILLGSILSGVPQGKTNLFQSYYETFSILLPIFPFLFSFSLCSTYLNLALSFGARRVDFFWALQGVIILQTLLYTLLHRVMLVIPYLFAWDGLEHWVLLPSMKEQPIWFLPLVCLCAQIIGCLGGLLFVRSKVWAMVVLIAASIFFSIFMCLMIFTAVIDLALWGDLPWISTLVMVVAAAVSECFVWRKVKYAVVR